MTAEVIMKEEMVGVPWWLVLLQGISLLILGILFVIAPGMTTVVAVQFLGVYWFVIGIFSIVSIFVDKSLWGWKLLSGILGVIAGLIVMQHPIWSPLVIGNVLVIILAVEGIIIGIVHLIQSFQGAGWGMAILGVVSVIIGILLLTNIWAFTFALPLALGILALIGGITSIVAAVQMK